MWRATMAQNAVNPARAGMILQVVGHQRPDHGKPRASGDDPTFGTADAISYE